jgi:5-hydroxyisourate hydrolase
MAESRISTHVLDIAQGRPAQGIPVTLEGQGLAGIWKLLGKSRTDADGRSNDLYPAKQRLQPGVYRLTFDVSTYFRSQHVTSFYPEVVVIFSSVRRGTAVPHSAAPEPLRLQHLSRELREDRRSTLPVIPAPPPTRECRRSLCSLSAWHAGAASPRLRRQG